MISQVKKKRNKFTLANLRLEARVDLYGKPLWTKMPIFLY